MVDLSTGSRIAGYRIEGVAGRGGMGIVYRATQLALGRPVALKLISPVLADDPRFRERFERESHLAASIDHPNVIPVYEAGENEGFLFLSMRWVEGTDLATLISQSDGLEPTRVTRIVAQVAAALDAAHDHGLVHRDVKPGNVLIAAGRSEHAYLTDFGLVKRIAGGGDLTSSGELVGTLDYIAPERIIGKGGDARSDVYSLGCLLFHGLTGHVPFEREDEVAKMFAHLTEAPPRASDVVPELAGPLDDVLARALAKEPSERYPSAGDLGGAAVGTVDEMAREREVASSSGAPTAVIPAPPSSRRRWLLRLGGVVGVVAAAVAGVVLLERAAGNRSGSPTRPQAVVPSDGTLFRGRRASGLYVVKAGAKFRIPRAERRVFGYGRDAVHVVSRSALGAIPRIPRERSFVKTYRSSVVWQVRHGERSLAAALPGADVAVIPSTGLPQIPTPRGRHKTSIAVSAPSSVREASFFHLRATVSSRRGVPRGACVFLRIGRHSLKERANTPTHHGRCEAIVAVKRLTQVRYLGRFIGDRHWRDSSATTPVIQVIPR
jgi:Protein kinase domain